MRGDGVRVTVVPPAGESLGGLVRARFRFTVFPGPDGVVMGRAQEKILSLPMLTPSEEVLENEHRHTFSELDRSFRSASTAS